MSKQVKTSPVENATWLPVGIKANEVKVVVIGGDKESCELIETLVNDRRIHSIKFITNNPCVNIAALG